MLRKGITVTGTKQWGSARKCRQVHPQGQLAGGQQAPGRTGCYPEAAASERKQPSWSVVGTTEQARHVAGAKACGGQAPGVLGSVQGKVSAFTSRHLQQHWSLALALFGVAAAHGHGGGGRKQNRKKIARWAKQGTRSQEMVGTPASGVLGSRRHAHTGQSPSKYLTGSGVPSLAVCQ